MSRKPSVLFICTANSARSLMAEALLRHHASDLFETASAGLAPTEPDPRALEALEHSGIDTGSLKSKSLDAVDARSFDFVITLCDKAAQECHSIRGIRDTLAWDFEDPRKRAGAQPYEKTLNELNERIKMFVLVQTKPKRSAQ